MDNSETCMIDFKVVQGSSNKQQITATILKIHLPVQTSRLEALKVKAKNRCAC